MENQNQSEEIVRQADFQKKFVTDQGAALDSVRHVWQQIIVANISESLRQRAENTWADADDKIFGAHTLFVKFAIAHRDPLPAIDIWENKIAPDVLLAEAHLAKNGSPQPRIHKGAPLFNVGVACYVAGNLERAFGYVAAAGEENEKSGRGSPFPILIGDDILSRRFLIKPIVDRYFPVWAEDYKNVTNRDLNEAEFVDVLKNLAQRPADAIQFLFALHRFLKADLSFENYATKHIRTRAVAEALVALESTLRRSQGDAAGELRTQLEKLVKANGAVKSSFDNFTKDFDSCIKGGAFDKRSPAAVNWTNMEAQTRLANETTVAGRAGIACYLALRLRNSLLHVVEDSLDMFQQKSLCERCLGLALATVRLAKHGEDATLAAL